MIQMNNRIAGLLDAPTPAPGPARSQPQAEDHNGHHSPGPRTAAGKRRSRANAKRHGLTAKVITPTRGTEEHARYKHILSELHAEFEPSTFSARALVDGLAHDHLRLSIAHEMLNHALQPPVAPAVRSYEHSDGDDLTAVARLRENRRDLKLISMFNRRVEAGEVLRFGDRPARRLAELVGEAVRWVDEEVEELNADEAVDDSEPPGDAEEDDGGSADWQADLDAEEKAEIENIRRLEGVVKRASRVLRDRAHLAGVFRGERAVPRAQLKKVRELLGQAAVIARQQAASRAKAEQRQRRQREEFIGQLAADPAQLERLQLYMERIERAIRKKTAELRAT